MYYVYIIFSKKINKKYIGFTKNLKRRISEHNKGIGSVFTTKGLPWKLIYYQCFINENDARAEEMFLKSGKGRERLKFLLKSTLII